MVTLRLDSALSNWPGSLLFPDTTREGRPEDDYLIRTDDSGGEPRQRKLM